VLREQHAAQLRKPVRRVIEHSQDRFAVGDRERDEITPRVQRDKERIGRVLGAGVEEEPRKVGDVLFAHGNTGGPHDIRATRRRERTNGASGSREDLDCQRPFAEPRRDNRETAGRRCSLDGRRVGGFQNRRVSDVLAHPPLCPSRTYNRADRKISARASILDVAIREAKKQDRRSRPVVTGAFLWVSHSVSLSALPDAKARAAGSQGGRRSYVVEGSVLLLGPLPIIGRGLHAKDDRAAFALRDHPPGFSPSLDHLADARSRTRASVELEVTVRIADLEESTGHGLPSHGALPSKLPAAPEVKHGPAA
jgi:hypothetical protein